MKDWDRVLGEDRLETNNRRLRALVSEAASQFPERESPLRSVARIQLKKRGRMKGLVGLTTYCCVEPENRRKQDNRRTSPKKQKIVFYSELLNQLSDSAALGVIAHELAHAWLNEHLSPEASSEREREADELARKWGYGRYLDALEAETVED